MAVATAVHWFFQTFIISLPILAFTIVEESGGEISFWQANSLFFFAFSGMSLLGFFLITIYVKETKDKSRNEITDLFGRNIYGS
mmetsp:Transcript_21574/g.19138  ORF Transcript_21574/g.19138 Transcript_21574/m.19138 type:complete len:84 (+) Transcript_21574:289-540(+)